MTADTAISEPVTPHPVAPDPARAPADEDPVLVVAVRGGPEVWRRTSTYVTRAGAGSSRASWLAFYSDRQVHAPVVRVLGVAARVPLSAVEADRRRALGGVLDRHVAAALDDTRERGGPSGDAVDVWLLSGPADPQTQDCGGIVHDGPTGWCRSRRYTTWGLLRGATSTADLAVPAAATEGHEGAT